MAGALNLYNLLVCVCISEPAGLVQFGIMVVNYKDGYRLRTWQQRGPMYADVQGVNICTGRSFKRR
jgi:hypothetical protein